MVFRSPYLVAYATEPFCAATAARPTCQDVLVGECDAPERTAAACTLQHEHARDSLSVRTSSEISSGLQYSPCPSHVEVQRGDS
jgi:hypothetical protein